MIHSGSYLNEQKRHTTVISEKRKNLECLYAAKKSRFNQRSLSHIRQRTTKSRIPNTLASDKISKSFLIYKAVIEA